MNNENFNNIDDQSNVTNIPVNDAPIDDIPMESSPIDESQLYDMPSGEFFEDSQSNINKSINNPTNVVDQYNQVSNEYIDDSEGISSYEDQIQNSEDIELYTQQPKNSDLPDNYNDEYVFNEDMNNYDNQYYDDNYVDYDDGYGNDYYDNQNMYGNNDTVAYNNSGYSNYGNNFDALNSGGYNNMNNNFTVAPSYAPPTNNMVNFSQQPVQPVQTVAVQPIPTVQIVTQPVVPTVQTVAVPPTTNELNSDGSIHPKTIGPEEFQRKVRASRRPFNFMLLVIYGLIIAVIGYFIHALWVEHNSYTFSKEQINLVQGYSYTEVIYEKGKLDLNSNYEWKSENDTIATVDGNGKISAKSVGTVNIVVKSKKTKKVKKIIVEVVNIKIQSLSISPKDKALKVGEAYSVYPSINGSTKYTLNFIWKSSNENVATVSGDGTITTKNPGTTVITVSIPNTKYKATMNIKVK